MMTCILSQVSESFKNSLKRSTAGTATDKTEIRKRTRPATAPATSTRAQQSPSSERLPNSTLSTTEFDSQRIEPERVLVGLRTVQVVPRPDVDLSTVENVQQVKIVWTGDEWELHFVCKVEIDVDEAPGEKTVGVDLGINNFAALAYEDGHSELA